MTQEEFDGLFEVAMESYLKTGKVDKEELKKKRAAGSTKPTEDVKDPAGKSIVSETPAENSRNEATPSLEKPAEESKSRCPYYMPASAGMGEAEKPMGKAEWLKSTKGLSAYWDYLTACTCDETEDICPMSLGEWSNSLCGVSAYREYIDSFEGKKTAYRKYIESCLSRQQAMDCRHKEHARNIENRPEGKAHGRPAIKVEPGQVAELYSRTKELCGRLLDPTVETVADLADEIPALLVILHRMNPKDIDGVIQKAAQKILEFSRKKRKASGCEDGDSIFGFKWVDKLVEGMADGSLL